LRTLPRARRLLAAATVGAACSLLVVNPAQADHNNDRAYGTTFVDGAGEIRDDFGDHYGEIGLICYGCANSWNTDIVVMWQAILWAEELLGSSDIDGMFGPKTRDATKAWQSRFGLTADGLVGNATWRAADDRLSWSNYNINNIVSYRAKKHYNSTVTFRRGNRDIKPFEGAYQLLQTNGVNGRGIIRFSSSSHRIWFSTRTLSVNVCPC
jgi:peptidoglycan hydrolase-like protein with peptidoglycan-binding domain